MASTIIYIGTGILLLGALIGFIAAIIAYAKKRKIALTNPFITGAIPMPLKRFLRAWLLIMSIGFITIAIGSAIS